MLYVAKGEQAHLKCQAKGDYPIAIHWFKNRNRLEPINQQNSALLSAASHQQTALSSLLGASSSSSGVSSMTMTTNGATTSNQQSLISSTIASILLLPSSAGLPVAPLDTHSADGKQRSNAIDLLNAHLFLTSNGQQERHDDGIMLNVNQQTKQQGVLMQKYTLANTELALSGGARFIAGASNSADPPTITAASAIDNPLQPVVSQLSSLMSISQVERQDTATFKCFAANQYGFDERTIQLIVQEPPDRIEELSVLETSSRSVTLAWLAPYDGNTPITSYHIRYRPLANAASNNLPPMNKPQMPSPNELNSSSQSLSNSWLNYTLSASSNSNNNNNINETGGSHLHQYSARFNLEAPSSGAASLVKLTIQSLKPVTHYWFQVQAENKLGLGSISSVVEAITIEEAPGAAPTKLKAVAQSSSSILVSWSKVNEKEVFGSVNGYYVAYRPLTGETSNSLMANNNNNNNKSLAPESALFQNEPQTTPSPVTNIYKTTQHDDKLSKFDALLSGLKRSTKYMISVQAFNNRGTGPSTEPIVLKTLDMDPPRQVKLYVKQTTNCSLQLEWRPQSQAALIGAQNQAQNKADLAGATTTSHLLPLAMPLLAGSDASNINQIITTTKQTNLDADVVDYYNLYQAELNEQPRWQELRLPGHLSSYSVENLRCGTRYQFYMMGVNRIGIGDQSDILDTKTAGGLPLAPDRQSTFDVINTTCYTIRLDHWQDNDCPIKEFNIRYKPEQARDWNHLAHFNLLTDTTGGYTSETGDSNAATNAAVGRSTKQFASDSSLFWPVRARRSVKPFEHYRSRRFVDKEDIYVFANDNDNLDLGEHANEDDDAFLDYSAESANADFGFDYNAVSNANFMDQTSSKITNSSPLISATPMDQGNKLFSLLKDSMLPTFASSGELNLQSNLETNHERQLSDSSPLTNAAPVAQGWRSALEFSATDNLQNSAPNSATLEQVASKQAHRQTGADLPNGPNSGPSRNMGHSNRQAIGDWRRVRFCNLIENIYYSVQITALNSVGETEAELRLLTSQEGLEYDQDIKRQVVGKLDGGDRLAQSVTGSNGNDRYNLFALNHWQILLPATLIVVLFIMIIGLALRRSNPSGGSTSTTTTTTGSSGSANHCHNYLKSNDQHSDSSQFKLQPNGCGDDITTSNIMFNGDRSLDKYALTAPRLEGFGNAHNGAMTMYPTRRTDHSVFGGTIDEPAYGVVGVNQHLIPHSSNLVSFSNETNRSSGSPATTIPSSSMNSGSTNSDRSQFNHHRHHGTMFVRSEVPSSSQVEAKTLGRNVYLCSAANVQNKNDETSSLSNDPANKQQDTQGAIYYGVQGNNIYAHHNTVQVRHFQPQQQQQLHEESHQTMTNKETVNSYLSNQQNFQQPNDLYGGLTQPHPNELMEPNGCENNGKQLDNCFMTIVEEVARASDSLNQQQQQQQQSSQLNLAIGKPEQHMVEQFNTNNQSCNQTNCFIQQPFQGNTQSLANLAHQSGNQVQSNYASVIASSVDEFNQFNHQQKGLQQKEQTNEQLQSTANRLMFDPVYATIRRTFPQAIRYLTLQHNHHNETGPNNLQRFIFPQQQQEQQQQQQPQQQQHQQQVSCDQNSHNT